jgi:beta-galactosidase
VNALLRLLVLGASLLACLFAHARETIYLRDGWKFIKSDVAIDTPTDKWESVTLPHTWNATDGQGGRKAHPEFTDGYYRGPAWYAYTFNPPTEWKNKRLFIRFEAASTVAQVYLNGKLLGEHRGGFTAFCFELTQGLREGLNEIRVRVDNTERDDVSPLTGDFNLDGGLYRLAYLIVTDPVCISPLDYASPGVYLTTKKLTPDEAIVEIKTILSNGSTSVVSPKVLTVISDRDKQVCTTPPTELPSLGPGESRALVQTVHIPHPAFWRGREDPYLYQATINLFVGKFADTIRQPLGLRTVAITNELGFLLNGQPYPIHGVNAHQDFGDKGWAMSHADHDADMKLMLDMGVTAIRLAHYPQSDYVHDLADRNGILLWNEIPMVNAVRDTPGFKADISQQLHEMILQRYNHPSAAFWGMFNEIGKVMDPIAVPVVEELKREQKELDPTRLNVAASSEFGAGFDSVPDWICYNPYPGWYRGSPGDLTRYIEDRYRENGDKRIGLSEYGAGGNPFQHQEGELSRPKPFGAFHPEEWQSYVHEQDWAQIKNNPKLWGSFLWCMFDFASSHRNEGGVPGVNDKGLVTADRKIRKDAYYFYQANWTDTPMLHINDRRSVDRRMSPTEVEVYSNCPGVDLKLNGKSLGVVVPDELHICRWKNVELEPGTDSFEATSPGTTLSDKCVWLYTPN